MKKNFLLLSAVMLLAASSCTSPYGKRVKINDSMEIYMKGDNVTEDEAKKLGNYLADLWKDASNEKSLQLSKDNDIYTVKMVVNQEKLKADPSLEEAFVAVQTLLEQQVFTGQKVAFIITDDHFDTIKSFEGKTLE
jgi:hypothetical protein